MKHFTNTRVVTRNFIKDWTQGIRNMLGLRLPAYEEIIDKNIKEQLQEIEKNGKINWHRINIQEISNEATIINIYGQQEEQK